MANIQIMEWQNNKFILSTDKSRLQIDRIHLFLSTQAYWSLDIPKSVVDNAIQGSICFGLYDESFQGVQIGFARIVTDKATFAWICDVYIERGYRGKGLSKWLIESLMTYPAIKNLRRICLATKDAHSLYQ